MSCFLKEKSLIRLSHVISDDTMLSDMQYCGCKEQKLTVEQQTPGLEKKTHLHISSCNCAMNPQYLLTNGQYYLNVIIVVFSVRKYDM